MEKILELLSVSPSILAAISMAIELACRLAQTEKPMGILHGIAAILRKLADLSDSVLPQRIKQVDHE
jgi:hypothetical protein